LDGYDGRNHCPGMATSNADQNLTMDYNNKVCTIVVDKNIQFLSFLRPQIFNNKYRYSMILLKAETDQIYHHLI